VGDLGLIWFLVVSECSELGWVSFHLPCSYQLSFPKLFVQTFFLFFENLQRCMHLILRTTHIHTHYALYIACVHTHAGCVQHMSLLFWKTKFENIFLFLQETCGSQVFLSSRSFCCLVFRQYAGSYFLWNKKKNPSCLSVFPSIFGLFLSWIMYYAVSFSIFC